MQHAYGYKEVKIFVEIFERKVPRGRLDNGMMDPKEIWNENARFI